MNASSLLAFTTKVDSAYTSACQGVFREFGLSKVSFDILMFLTNNPDRYTAKDICLYRNLKANVVSIHVDQLVQDGYLQRQRVEGDRRKIRLVCTEAARPVIERGRAVQRAFYEQLVDGLSQEDLMIFRRCFRVMGTNAHRLQTETIASNGGNQIC